jgi:hypothetical protein
MEDWMWSRMLWNVGFLGATYLPLQFVAIRRAKSRYSKIMAGLPLLVMVPVLVGAMSPNAYRDGSLFGMAYICPYLPSIIWLGVACLAADRPCPVCGTPLPKMALSRAGLKCPRCFPRDGSPVTEPDRANANDAGAAG